MECFSQYGDNESWDDNHDDLDDGDDDDDDDEVGRRRKDSLGHTVEFINFQPTL